MRLKNVGSLMLAIAAAVVVSIGAAGLNQSDGPFPAVDDTQWTSLFDGTSLARWTATGGPASIRVADGAMVCGGPGARLVYAGDDGRASFETFELSVEVNARPGADARISFHTSAEPGRVVPPGVDLLIRPSRTADDREARYARTGSLLGIRDVYKSMAAPDTWFIMTVKVQKPQVQVRIDGTLVVDYREPDAWPVGGPAVARLARGTFALQCGNAPDGVRYRNLRVRPLTPTTGMAVSPAPVVDAAYLQILKLTKAGFPVIDLHAHLKGGLTMEQVLDLSRRTGMFLGLAVNCGKGFPIEDDAGALAALETMRGQPVFVAMQAEGREWVQAFSKGTRARFDYVFTDGMTWTNPAGRRMRLWLPDEVEIGPDEQAFMDLLVSKIVGILENEPIDIYVNPTFLPAAIQKDYDTLWTKPRMKRVIDAAVRNGVAIEINARYRIPSERFLRLAKASGARFTFGTNNAGAADLGDWSYPLRMQKALGLTPQDMFVPGLQPSRAQRE